MTCVICHSVTHALHCGTCAAGHLVVNGTPRTISAASGLPIARASRTLIPHMRHASHSLTSGLRARASRIEDRMIEWIDATR